MSWTMNVSLAHEQTGIGWQRDLDALNAAVPSGNEQCVKERDEQVDAAIRATFQALTTGDIFVNAEEITVSMVGHANKNHRLDDSYANEFIQINIAVKKYRAS